MRVKVIFEKIVKCRNCIIERRYKTVPAVHLSRWEMIQVQRQLQDRDGVTEIYK